MIGNLPLQNVIFLTGLSVVIVGGLLWLVYRYIKTPDPWAHHQPSIRDRLQTDEAKEKFDQLSRENQEMKRGEGNGV